MRVRNVALLATMTVAAGGLIAFGFASAAYAGPTSPSISTSQQPTSATAGSSIADKATVTGLQQPFSPDTVTFNLYSSATVQNATTLLYTNTQRIILNGLYICPASDQEGVPIGQFSDSSDPIFCSYPEYAGENPDDFYCKYDGSTGALVTDNDSGACPPIAFSEVASAGTATSAGYTATASGTDYWVATYNGDSNNNSVSSGAAAEPVTITKASTSLTADPQVVLLNPRDGVGLGVVEATLTSGGVPVQGATIDFSWSGHQGCSAPTNASGVARCTISLLNELFVLLHNQYAANYTGSPGYASSTASTTAVEIG